MEHEDKQVKSDGGILILQRFHFIQNTLNTHERTVHLEKMVIQLEIVEEAPLRDLISANKHR